MKPTAQTKSGESASAVPQVTRWHIVASVLIALHVTAVWVAPFSAPPSSPLSGSLRTIFRPYQDALFLNHGYKFFAPDPGPTHLVRYELVLADGSKKTGVFPNLKQQWPRLLYHRHMMLSEHVDGPPAMTWLPAYAKSYAQHLLSEHDAKSVTLHLVEHLLAYPQQVQQGMKLDDPSLYRERQLLTLKRGES